MNRNTSKQLYDKALVLLPGGVNSPVRAFKAVGGDPVFMKSGNGAYLTDVDDNRYIDYCMSWGPLILGHAHPIVVAAVKEAAEAGTSFGTPNPFEIEIAEMLTGIVPSIEKVRFVNSGTEATMSAIRLARGYTGKNKIIKFDGCYHGHADHLLVAAGSGLATFSVPDSAGVTRANAADTLIAPFNNIDALKHVIASNTGEIAAIIMEPLPCNYGLIVPQEEYLQEIRTLCDRNDIILIFDEVISGLRLAQGGAQEYYGIKADLTTLGKIIGGGLPVGAYGGRTDIMSHVAPEGPVYQAGTLSGNPIAMAAGIATLKQLSDLSVYDYLHELSKQFKAAMRPVLKKYNSQVQLIQVESIFAFFFTEKKQINTVDDVNTADIKLFAAFHKKLLEKGIYIAPSGFEVGFLSNAHSKEDLSVTVKAIEESLDFIL